MKWNFALKPFEGRIGGHACMAYSTRGMHKSSRRFGVLMPGLTGPNNQPIGPEDIYRVGMRGIMRLMSSSRNMPVLHAVYEKQEQVMYRILQDCLVTNEIMQEVQYSCLLG